MSQLFSQTQLQSLSQSQSHSQSQAQQQDPTWTTVPLAKFSHITSAPGVKSFVWTHVNRDDLVLVFRTARLLDHDGNLVNRFLMEVNAGTSLLESQDLGDLVKFSKESIPNSGIDRPVDIVIRCPFLAMRYPKNHISVRRIQVKFRNDNDFNIAVNVLKNLGLSLTDNVAPRSVVTPAPAPPLSSSTYSFGSTTGSVSRPPSVKPSFSGTSNQSFGTAFSSPVIAELKASPAVSSSTLSGLNSRPDSTNSVDTRSGAGTSGSINSAATMIRPSTSALVPKNSLYFQQMNKEIRPMPLASGPDTISRTTSASPYFNKDAFGALNGNIEDPFIQSQSHSANFKFKVPETRRLPFSTQTVYVSPTRQRQERPASLVHMMPSSRQFKITDEPLPQVNQDRSASIDLMIPPRRTLPFPAEPLSQAIIHSQDSSASVDYILPPRRTLPFPSEQESRGRSRGRSSTVCERCTKNKVMCDGKEPCDLCSNSGQECVYPQVQVPRTSSALAVGTIEPPGSPVKKPTLAPVVEEGPLTPTHKPVRRRVASRTLPPAIILLQPAASISDQRVEASSSMAAQTAPAISKPSPAATTSTAFGPSLATAEPQSRAAPAKKRATAPNRPTSASKRSKMVNGATQTRTLSVNEHTELQRAPSLSNNPGLDASQAATPSSPESPPDSYLNALDIHVSKYKNQPPPRELWQAPRYEEASEEERSNMLNSFICDNLEDPSFLQLCEDTDKAWRRLGLGL